LLELNIAELAILMFLLRGNYSDEDGIFRNFSTVKIILNFVFKNLREIKIGEKFKISETVKIGK
jgi:hypothetical protein